MDTETQEQQTRRLEDVPVDLVDPDRNVSRGMRQLLMRIG